MTQQNITSVIWADFVSNCWRTKVLYICDFIVARNNSDAANSYISSVHVYYEYHLIEINVMFPTVGWRLLV